MAAKAKPLGMTEGELHTKVCKLFRDHDWRVYSVPRSQHGGPGRAGFPDLMLYRERQVLAIELKTNSGKLKEEQKEWLNALGQALPALVLRPAHWDAGFFHILANDGYSPDWWDRLVLFTQSKQKKEVA